MRLDSRIDIGLFMVLAGFFAETTHAQTVYPYAERHADYSGWDTTLKGDINTIGMGGATVALPTSISAAESNPAGFAMSMGSLSAQINKNSTHDNLLKQDDRITEYQWGLGVSPPPWWGFAITYYSPKLESGRYVSPNTGAALDSEVSVKQLRVVMARAFFDSTFSFGLSIGFNHGIRKLSDSVSYNATAFALSVGGLYRLPKHWVIGASYSPGFTVRPSGDPDQIDLPGFNRAIISPARTAFGLGWIPNRFFKAGVGVYILGSTPSTALLADESRVIGRTTTAQPRLGVSYVLAEFNNFKVEGAIGTYFEPSRIDGVNNRLHATAGLEVNPWFINTGVGMDVSSGYDNFMVSIGIDIVRTMRALDLIPKDAVPPYSGILPNIEHVNPDGLPEGLTMDDPKGTASPSLGDVGQIIKDIPKRAGEKMSGVKVRSSTPPNQKKKTKGVKKPPSR